LEELVEEATDLGQDPEALWNRDVVVLREREPPPGAVQAAGVLVEITGSHRRPQRHQRQLRVQELSVL
jgi:hypothetical protein